MRVVLGVESAETARELSGWVRALGLAEPREEWVHQVPSQNRAVWSLDPLLAVERISQLEEQAAERMEHALVAAAQEQGGDIHVRVRIGHPAEGLLNRADETDAALMAVRASNKGPLSALLLGSVARAMVEGANQSVLLTRGAAPTRPLRVLLATDHSAYMDQVLELLASWNLKGIGQLTVLHVLPPPLRAEIDQLAREVAHEALGRDFKTPEELTHATAQTLAAALGLPDTSVGVRIVAGSISEGIATTLAETEADILFLGAKGHSLLDRLTLGSVSFHAVMTCPKSVLILRA